MSEDIVAAGTAMRVTVFARGIGWPVLNPYTFSLGSGESRAIALSLCVSSAQSVIDGLDLLFKKNEPGVPYYICGADTSLINDVTLVV